jgi:hypothetical protein
MTIDQTAQTLPAAEDKTPLTLRDELKAAKAGFGQGRLTVAELEAAADAYIASLKAYKKRTGAKIAIPARGYLIRAI